MVEEFFGKLKVESGEEENPPSKPIILQPPPANPLITGQQGQQFHKSITQQTEDFNLFLQTLSKLQQKHHNTLK